MDTRRSQRGVRWLAAVLCVLPVVALVPGCGGGNGTTFFNGITNPGVATFAGQYTGTMQGAATGTMNFTVASDGTLNATVNSGNLRSVLTGTGTVRDNGDFTFTVAAGQDTVTFAGTLGRQADASFGVTGGTWHSTSGQRGSFTARYVAHPATPTPTRPSPTATPGGPTPTPTRPSLTPTPTRPGPTPTPRGTALEAATYFPLHAGEVLNYEQILTVSGQTLELNIAHKVLAPTVVNGSSTFPDHQLA